MQSNNFYYEDYRIIKSGKTEYKKSLNDLRSEFLIAGNEDVRALKYFITSKCKCSNE